MLPKSAGKALPVSVDMVQLVLSSQASKERRLTKCKFQSTRLRTAREQRIASMLLQNSESRANFLEVCWS